MNKSLNDGVVNNFVNSATAVYNGNVDNDVDSLKNKCVNKIFPIHGNK